MNQKKPERAKGLLSRLASKVTRNLVKQLTDEDGDFYESLKKTVRNRDLDSDSSFERMFHVGPQEDELDADREEY